MFDDNSKDKSSFGSFLVSGASSLGTGLLNFGFNQASAAIQRNWQEKMMDKQNAYNSPLAQANRMRAAGLNPYQDMGSVPSASAGTGAAGSPVSLSDPLMMLSAFAQLDKTRAEAGSIETTTEKTLKEISMLDLAYERGLIELEDYSKRVKSLWDAYDSTGETPETISLKQSIQDVEKTEAETNSIRHNTALLEEQTTLAKKQQDIAELQKDYQKMLNDNLPEKLLLENRESIARTAADYATAYAANANAQRTHDQNSREAEQHDMNLAIDELRKQGLISENQAIAVKARVEQAWNEGVFGQDAKGHRWQNFEMIVNDFFHTNLNLSGSGGIVVKK